MDEGSGVEVSTGTQRRVLARLGERQAGSDTALHASLPALGTVVGGFTLEALLGEGGYGTVYLARRGEHLCAVKFIFLPQLAVRARRELEVMLRLEEVGGAGLKGHGVWPDEAPRFLFIAMEYVPGEELYAWATYHNPTALEAVEVLLELARKVAVVHSAGVVHRDIKGDNVLVRHADGVPVLLDFSVATYQGARRVTGSEVPGCREYLSPQAVRFTREHAPGAHYPPSTGDDLWALGVLAYKLLTATQPFHGNNALETETAILHAAPEPPHARNPRVPRALGEVGLRLLEKAPQARYPDAEALVAALEEVKRGADAAWRVPLCEAWGPDAATTGREGPLGMEELAARLKRLVEYERHHPRRGVPRPEEAPPSLAVESPVRAGATRTGSRWTVGPGVRGGVLVVAALLCAGLGWRVFGPVPSSGPAAPVVTSRVVSRIPTPEVTSHGQEMAPWWKPPEGGGGAAPGWAATPAPVASATLSKDTRVKTSRKDSAPQDNEPRAPKPGPRVKETLTSAGKAGAVMLTYAMSTGCPGPGAQVRPEPEPGPAECPAGSADVMRALGAWSRFAVTLLPDEDDRSLTVSGGEVTVRPFQSHGRLKAGSTLTGQLLVTDQRVYGRFTQARLANGETFPVCFEFFEVQTGACAPDKPWASVEEPAPGPGLARIFAVQGVRPTERFHVEPVATCPEAGAGKR